MRSGNRKQIAAAAGGPWLTFEQLAERWARNPKTIANGISSGRIPLPVVRLYPGADPLVHRGDVEQLEARALSEAAAGRGV